MVFFNTHTHFSKSPDFEILNIDLSQESTVYHSISLHPSNVSMADVSSLKHDLALNLNDNLLAIGEVGLDKLHKENFEIQINSFREIVLLSEIYKLPLILHCVKAWNELLQINNELKPIQNWIYHGFNKANILDEVLKTKIIISIGENILTNKKLQNKINQIPLNRLLLETDDNTISIEIIYQKVAEIYKIEIEELCEQIKINFSNTFVKWKNG